MIGFCPLASGSKGNCIYLGTANTRILIDAGISTKATKERLAQLDIDISTIDAILITHEHSDHIQGLKVLAFKMGIPVFANADTARSICSILQKTPQFKIFTTGESFTFGDLEIHPFSIQHDTEDPVAFTIKTHDLKLGFCTDLGFVTTLVRHHLQDCDYLYLESNHKPSMVHACPRPQSYKQRVLGRSGHLSNEACSELLQEIAHANLKHVHLAHLSEECNTPALAHETVFNAIKHDYPDLPISVAAQRYISKAIHFPIALSPSQAQLEALPQSSR